MTGFQAPNYTQVPNDLFEIAAQMGDAELRVMLCIIRETFGYHRARARLSIRAIARATGLTPRNAHAGARAAEARGLIKSTVSLGDTTEWEAVVAGDTLLLSLGIQTVSPGTANLGLKKEKKYHSIRKEKRSPLDQLRDFMEAAS